MSETSDFFLYVRKMMASNTLEERKRWERRIRDLSNNKQANKEQCPQTSRPS